MLLKFYEIIDSLQITWCVMVSTHGCFLFSRAMNATVIVLIPNFYSPNAAMNEPYCCV